MWFCAADVTSFVCIHPLLRSRKIWVSLLFFPLGRHKSLAYQYSQNIVQCSNGCLLTSKPVNTPLSVTGRSFLVISSQNLIPKNKSQKCASSSMGKLFLLRQVPHHQNARKWAIQGHKEYTTIKNCCAKSALCMRFSTALRDHVPVNIRKKANDFHWPYVQK